VNISDRDQQIAELQRAKEPWVRTAPGRLLRRFGRRLRSWSTLREVESEAPWLPAIVEIVA
jgi:hypothetical protein